MNIKSISKNIREGMLFEANAIEVQDRTYCKIIVSDVISDNAFVNECSLLYIYKSQISNGVFKLKQDFSSLISINIVHLKNGIPKYLKYIGDELILDWEKNLDIGIKCYTKGSWISNEQISDYEKNHLILSSSYDRNIAIPFYDVYNVQLDHIPIFQLEEGCTTFGGLLKNLN